MPTLVPQVPRQEAACLVFFLASKAHVPAGELPRTILTDPVLLQVQSSILYSSVLVPHAVLRRAGIGLVGKTALRCVWCAGVHGCPANAISPTCVQLANRSVTSIVLDCD